jgi:hypothetical protein
MISARCQQTPCRLTRYQEHSFDMITGTVNNPTPKVPVTLYKIREFISIYIYIYINIILCSIILPSRLFAAGSI